jgi:hypothetical protein
MDKLVETALDEPIEHGLWKIDLEALDLRSICAIETRR